MTAVPPVPIDQVRDLTIAALGITTTGTPPPRIVTFPEAVTLAGILTDLDWRRDVALEWTDDRPFYQQIAEDQWRELGAAERWQACMDDLRARRGPGHDSTRPRGTTSGSMTGSARSTCAPTTNGPP